MDKSLGICGSLELEKTMGMTDPKLRVQWELMLELSYELAGYRLDSV